MVLVEASNREQPSAHGNEERIGRIAKKDAWLAQE